MNLNLFIDSVKAELTGNILPFWAGRMPDPRGGFYGRMTGAGEIDTEAPKGSILNSRILWTFSAAYRVLGDKKYLETAERAKREVIDRFFDKEYGGVFWSLNPDGSPLDTRKQLYAQGFALYGLSEFARATGDREAAIRSRELFEIIESRFFDAEDNGYFEAFARDWSKTDDMRLSDKDLNTEKSMNSHLHIIEPYTNLYRIWPDSRVKERIGNLIDIFASRILGSGSHLELFFDRHWNSSGKTVSYGHDIEFSWLLWEAAQAIGAAGELLDCTRDICLDVARAADGGIDSDGGMFSENVPEGQVKDWWVQAECIVGNVNAYEISGDEAFLQRALDCWEFIRRRIICPDGEWYWGVDASGGTDTRNDRAGFWKCPYHNARMCLEIIGRLSG